LQIAVQNTVKETANNTQQNQNLFSPILITSVIWFCWFTGAHSSH